MKFLRYIFVIVSLAAGVGLIERQHSTTFCKQEETTPTLAMLSQNLLQSLNKELIEVKKKLESIGIKTTTFDAIHKGNSKVSPGIVQPHTMKHGEELVSPQLRNLIQDIIKKTALDPESIGIIHDKNQDSEASSDENTIYLNEKLFSNLSQAAQRFIIAHELQHILFQDSKHYTKLAKRIGISAEELSDRGNLDHPLCHYSRFLEKRADLYAALMSPEYAQDYLTCTQEQLHQLGDDPFNGTHPTRSERVTLAQRAVNEIQHGSLCVA